MSKRLWNTREPNRELGQDVRRGLWSTGHSVHKPGNHPTEAGKSKSLECEGYESISVTRMSDESGPFPESTFIVGGDVRCVVFFHPVRGGMRLLYPGSFVLFVQMWPKYGE